MTKAKIGPRDDRKARFETLEERWTPAASIALAGNELRFTGDNSNNQAEVAYNGNNVVATISSGGRTARMVVQAGRVASVGFKGFGGNDSFINRLNAIPSRAWGGDGNDQLIGANATDQFWGGNGDDTLIGNGATDYLFGELGNDTINGGFGNDFLSGGKELNSIDRFFDGIGTNTFEDGFSFNRWIVDGTQARDVEQGTIGSCSTLSTIAQLADKGFNFASRIAQVAANTYRVTLDGLGQQTGEV
jgi:Ca2+-binding RTX toxin-like protein